MTSTGTVTTLTAHASEMLRRFVAVDAFLQTRGFPTTSPWWHRTVERFYVSGRRQLCARVGRRGGKSSTLCRLAAVEGVYGHHVIPPGDVGVVAFISTTRDEATQRLRTVKAILDALGVKYRPCDGGVELLDKPVAFKVYTASIGGVSGFTAILVIADEVSKWKDSDTGANPATEVLASVRPTMATQRNARIILSSSPLGKWDAHYDAFEQGEGEFQITAYAETWIANPTITEAETRALEPDEATWSREYKAIPAAEIAESLFTEAELDAATRAAPEELPREPGITYEAAQDPATRSNSWCLAIGALRYTASGMQRSIVLVREWRPGDPKVTDHETGALSPKKVFAVIAPLLATYGVQTLWTDQGSGADALRDIAHDAGIWLAPEPWTQANKIAAYKNLQTWVRSTQLDLPPVAQVKQDLLGVRRKYTRAGMTIDLLRTSDGRHADHAPAVALLASKLVASPVAAAKEPTGAELVEARRRARFEFYKAEAARPHWRAAGGSADRWRDAHWRRG